MGQILKALKLWLIAGAIALMIVILGRSPLPSNLGLPFLAGAVQAQLDAPADSESGPSPEGADNESDRTFYSDPQERFRVEVLEGFNELSVAGAPLFESADGAIAYTVVTQEVPTDDDEPLPAAALAAIAITTFNQGESFQNQPSERLASNPPSIQMPWVGSHTTASGTQSVSGKILVQQRSGTVFLVLVAATEAGRDRQDDIINTVFSSFTLL